VMTQLSRLDANDSFTIDPQAIPRPPRRSRSVQHIYVDEQTPSLLLLSAQSRYRCGVRQTPEIVQTAVIARGFC
jgi:hypothetical protein